MSIIDQLIYRQQTCRVKVKVSIHVYIVACQAHPALVKQAIWLFVTQLSRELHFGAKHDYEEKKRLSSTKESRFSKLLYKRAILARFFLSA